MTCSKDFRIDSFWSKTITLQILFIHKNYITLHEQSYKKQQHDNRGSFKGTSEWLSVIECAFSLTYCDNILWTFPHSVLFVWVIKCMTFEFFSICSLRKLWSRWKWALKKFEEKSRHFRCHFYSGCVWMGKDRDFL